MKPSERYHQIIQQSGFVHDQGQLHAMQLLDALVGQLSELLSSARGSWLKRIIGEKASKKQVKGIYFWGGVGRGKTFVMDIFFQSIPGQRKSRRHFHDFMNQIHRTLKQKSGLKNPLHAIGVEIADSIDVLCLDEFIVTDIADAMILSGLLDALFEAGLVLVTTSNSIPKNLYHDGLQRARFLPAIELIGNHCQVVNLDSGTDYRLAGLQQTHLYSVPHSNDVQREIQAYLDEHIASRQTRESSITINGRDIAFEVCAEDTIWFNFTALCKTARSQTDYLEIARLFNTIIVTEIEVMSAMQDDTARRFVLLIDILYDHRVKLICSAEADATGLYLGKRLAFEFERTSSRLIEMQSMQYLSQEHTQQ